MTLRENEASDEAWAKATRIARELDRILDGQEPMRTAVSRAASELRLSTRQVYNHLRDIVPNIGCLRCCQRQVELGARGSARLLRKSFWQPFGRCGFSPSNRTLRRLSMKSAPVVTARVLIRLPMSPFPSVSHDCSRPRRLHDGDIQEEKTYGA